MFYTTPTWFADSIIPRLHPVWQEKKIVNVAQGVSGNKASLQSLGTSTEPGKVANLQRMGRG